jgi:hypothetical protein
VSLENGHLMDLGVPTIRSDVFHRLWAEQRSGHGRTVQTRADARSEPSSSLSVLFPDR